MKVKVLLTVIDGPGQGKVFEFTEQDNFLLGRDEQGSRAHFRLDSHDEYVSRNHFLLEINPPDCYLREAGSLNGTFVVRKSKKTLFFIAGKEKTANLKFIEVNMRVYECENYLKKEEIIKLENDDLVVVGTTVIEVKMTQEAVKVPGNNKTGEPWRCIHCGIDISGRIPADKMETLSYNDLVCEKCHKKHFKIGAPKEPILCSLCRKDITQAANSDKRAEELEDTAFYWCKDCASAQQKEVPFSKIGEYLILEELGEGGFGVVYLAWQKKTGRVAALKLMKEKVKRDELLLLKFRREIAVMQQLIHPHLVRLYSEGIFENEYYYLVSEYLPERTLDILFAAYYNSSMTYKEACFFILQVLSGLVYFHNNGFVHRDLKPHNIFIKKENSGKLTAKIGDFGLAKSYILHGATITRPHEWAGTLFYCPPEQIVDFKNVKPCTDVYAVGMILYFLISGGFPYDFPTRKEFFAMLSKGEKPRDPLSIILGDDKPEPIEKKVRGIPAQLANTINRAIEKDISGRIPSAEEFKNLIERCVR